LPDSLTHPVLIHSKLQSSSAVGHEYYSSLASDRCTDSTWYNITTSM